MSALSSRIQALRVEGHSLAIIAATLSREEGRYYSRGAVAGLVHRAQLPKMERRPSKPRGPRKRKPSGLQLKAGFGFKSGADHVPMKRTRPERLPDPRITDVPSVSLVDVKSGQCRFVCSESRSPHDEIFCGARTLDGHPYCRAHFRRTHVEGGR